MRARIAQIARELKAEQILKQLIDSIADQRPASEIQKYREALQVLLGK